MNVTFCVKTHERPQHLKRLLDSIKYYYPHIRTIVADDSVSPSKYENVEVFHLPYDSGLSYGRNFLIDQVNTKYYVQLDDDFVFTKETVIEKFLALVERHQYNLIGGVVLHNGTPLNCVGSFVKTGKEISYSRVCLAEGDLFKCQVVPMFFIADRTLRYDEKLKHTEHFDFFYANMDKKVGYTTEVKIEHAHGDNPVGYDAKRKQGRQEYLNYVLKKHGISKLTSFTEVIKGDS